MHRQFPFLGDYEGDWALTYLTTAYLKKTKSKGTVKRQKDTVAAVGAVMRAISEA